MITLLKPSPPLWSRISHGLLLNLKTQKHPNNQSYTNSLNQPLSSIRCQWPRVHGTKKNIYHIKFMNKKFPHSRTNILQVIMYRYIILLPLYLRTRYNCLGINHFNVPTVIRKARKERRGLKPAFLSLGYADSQGAQGHISGGPWRRMEEKIPLTFSFSFNKECRKKVSYGLWTPKTFNISQSHYI